MAERSPNFPQISLGEAVDNVRLVYQREGRSKMPKLSAVRPLGYTSINGRSLGVLAALRSYGLLDGRGDDVSVSEDALTILNAPKDSEERHEALKRAFESPPAFALLRAKDGASADTLRWHLIKANFRDDAADKLIKVFLDSRAFLTAEAGPNVLDDLSATNDAPSGADAFTEDHSQQDPLTAPHARSSPSPMPPFQSARSSNVQPQLGAAIPDFIVKLGDDLTAIIEIKGGEPAPRHLAKLARFIDLQRQLLLDDDDDIGNREKENHMRYSVRKSGILATRAHHRATIDDALTLADEMRRDADQKEVVTLEDYETGQSYRNEEIDELRKAVQARYDL